jgi:hypothetical protein
VSMQQYVKPEIWYVLQKTWRLKSEAGSYAYGTWIDVNKYDSAEKACGAHAATTKHKTECWRVIIRFEHFWNGDL